MNESNKQPLRVTLEGYKKTAPSTSVVYIKAMLDVNDAVLAERQQQNVKWGKQHHNMGKWLAILGEEFGEVCQASQPSLGLTTGKDTDANNLYEELIQVAAVASAMAEQVIRERGSGNVGSK